MSEAHKAASRRLYEEVFGRGNLAVADEVMSPTSVNRGPGTPPDVGTEFIKRQAALLRGAMPDFRVSLLDQLAEGDRVASRWNGSGTFTGQFVLPSGALTANGACVSFDELRIDPVATAYNVNFDCAAAYRGSSRRKLSASTPSLRETW